MSFDFADARFRIEELAKFVRGKPRGDALEELVSDMLAAVPGVDVCQPNLLSAGGDEEIDRLVVNQQLSDGLRFFPQDVLVECKSQDAPVAAQDVRNLSVKLQERHLEMGIMVTAAGLTGVDGHRAGDLASEKSALRGHGILVLWTSELARVGSAQHLAALLEEKRRRLLAGWITREFGASEMRRINPDRRDGKVGVRYGWQAVERAIAETRRDALLEMLDRAGPHPEDFAAAVVDLKEQLEIIAEQCEQRRKDQTLDPLWRDVRESVAEFGAAVAALRVPGPHTAEAQRIIRHEVDRRSVAGIRPWVGGELWAFLTDYFVRQIEATPGVFRAEHVAILLGLCVESLITIDDIDPADVFEHEIHEAEG